VLFLVSCAGGELFLSSEKETEHWPEAERTSEGKYKCKKDNMEYDSREDYEAHCKEEHMEDMGDNKW